MVKDKHVKQIQLKSAEQLEGLDTLAGAMGHWRGTKTNASGLIQAIVQGDYLLLPTNTSLSQPEMLELLAIAKLHLAKKEGLEPGPRFKVVDLKLGVASGDAIEAMLAIEKIQIALGEFSE